MGMRTEGERTSFLLLAEEKKTRWMQKKKKNLKVLFSFCFRSAVAPRGGPSQFCTHTQPVYGA